MSNTDNYFLLISSLFSIQYLPYITSPTLVMVAQLNTVIITPLS
ncbi:MAG: hypothetical protein WC774_05930 [Candidatus Gracilibacteria bacterium]